MTTRLPGASEVLTQGLALRPALDGALGDEAGRHEHRGVRRVGARGDRGDGDRAVAQVLGGASPRPRRARAPSAVRNASRAPGSETRSWGRDGPARRGLDASTRSSSTYSEKMGSARRGVVPEALGLGVGLDELELGGSGRPVKAR